MVHENLNCSNAKLWVEKPIWRFYPSDFGRNLYKCIRNKHIDDFYRF